MARRVEETPPLRKWAVVDTDGVTHEIEAHYCFDNQHEGRGLMFRRYNDDQKGNGTYVVGSWATGFWKNYKEIKHG